MKCPTCKRSFKEENAWYRKHVEACLPETPLMKARREAAAMPPEPGKAPEAAPPRPPSFEDRMLTQLEAQEELLTQELGKIKALIAAVRNFQKGA